MTIPIMSSTSFVDTSEFAAFRAMFSSDLVLPGDKGYQDAIRRWAASAEQPAGVVAFVKTDEDVSLAIGFAVSAGLEVAVRGGGHSPSGASSTTGGMVIDLSRYMNKATCDPETQIVTVGGGALWADVDNATIQHGLATVCGTVSHTGVGGLTLGGGFGHLTGERGLVIDNLVGATVVTADGSILQASEDENQDLFWGIRGGGVNFGVVTTFKLKCYPQAPQVFCGMLLYTADKVEAVLAAADKFDREVMGPKEFVLAGMISAPKGIMVHVVLSHNGPAEEGKRKYQAFYDLGPIKDDTGSKPYTQLNRMMDIEQAHGTHLYMSAANQVTSPSDCAKPVSELFAKMLEETPAFGSSMIGFEFIKGDVVRSRPDDATAYNCRQFANNVLIIIKWNEENGTGLATKAKAYALSFRKLIDPGTKGVQTPYGNYESDSTPCEDKVKKLFGSNYPRLQQVKAKYDPNMVLGKWFPIVPKA